MSTRSNRAGFRRTRSDHAGEVAEDYVEAIEGIIAAAGECRLMALATQFGVSHVTAIKVVRRLKRDGLVAALPRGPIRLTPKGKRLAARSRERHAIVLQFLVALGVSKRTAKLDAEGIEHHVSLETLKAMQMFSGDRPG